jgi:hypothetical protein
MRRAIQNEPDGPTTTNAAEVGETALGRLLQDRPARACEQVPTPAAGASASSS